MRFGILRTKTVLGANVAGFILGTALFSMFLMLTLYMQQVLGYSAMKTGVAYLAVAGTSIIWANVAAAMVNRVGVRPLIAGGMGLLAVGMLLFTQIPVDGTYVANLLPGFLIIALGMALCFVPISIAALAGVSRAEAGIASGLINTSQQIGGAVGIALLSTVAITRTENEFASGAARPEALTSGFQLAFWVGTAIALVGVAAALVLIRQEEIAHAGEAAPVPAA
jgi:MFS family permease